MCKECMMHRHAARRSAFSCAVRPLKHKTFLQNLPAWVDLHTQPYTLNPTPSTLHPTPYTLNRTP